MPGNSNNTFSSVLKLTLDNADLGDPTKRQPDEPDCLRSG
jgi:hypothetical protein